jgi:parvulin-like peptidyl-prolyl isomerase
VAEDGKDRDAVQARALGMVSRLENGADIQAEATLAGVKVQDLGEIPVADLRDDIAAAVLQMKPGDVAGPFSTAGGYQIIRLVGRTATGYLPFDKVKEQVRRKVSAERYKEQSEGLVNRLKHEYLVETHPEMVDEVLEGKIGA